MRNYESLEDRFSMDGNGNFEHPSDVDIAVEDGALEELSNGLLWDRDTGYEYDRNGDRV